MNEFLDFCEKSLKAENADNCCPMKTASEYLGVSPFTEIRNYNGLRSVSDRYDNVRCRNRV